MFELRLFADSFVKRYEHVVDDQKSVARVVCDIGNVVWMKAKIERVEHPTRRGDSEVRLHVRVVVPHEGRDPVTPI